MTSASAEANQRPSPQLLNLVEGHEHFEQLMLMHQEALVGLELSEARRLFEQLRCRKVDHMQLEDRELLPLYAELGQWERGGNPEIIRAEHDQIYLMMNHLTQSLEDLDRPGQLTRRAVVEVLDAEKSFKGVLEHHSLREATHLYPALGRIDSEMGR